MKHIKRLVRLKSQFIELVRMVLEARTELCDPKCKGWLVDAEQHLPVRCDECAELNGYGDVLHDDDVAILPEASAAAQAKIRRAERQVARGKAESIEGRP